MRFANEEEYQKWLRDRESRRPAPNRELEEIGKRHGLTLKSKGPNKTETEYHRRLTLEYPGCSVKFEAISLHLDNGHRYTPDFTVDLSNGQILLVEVKNGAYRHASYGRSKMAFDQARVDFPMFTFRWAEKFSDGWKVKDF